MGYLGNFIVYTLAMVGVIVVALLVFKNATTISTGKSSKLLKVIDTLTIGQRKTLYIVSAGTEKFLIAGDVDRTCLISKLDNTEEPISAIATVENEDFSTRSFSNDYSTNSDNSFKDTMVSLTKPNFMDKSGLGMRSTSLGKQMKNSTYNSVIRNIAEKIRG